ncbi:unnamed protein product, partial [Pylaiella littoralis]
WTETCHDNNTLMGFIVYAMLFPKLLQTRIKLNASTYHWAHLDPASEKGRAKLEQRRGAVDRIKRHGFTQSVFMGLPYRIDTTNAKNILQFANMSIEEEDERYRFFTKREFSMMCSERGEVSSSSVYASCSTALSLLWFVTAVLARPCCPESVILPLTVAKKMMEQRFSCLSFHTNWRQVFTAIDTHHRNMEYTLLELATAQKYFEGVHIADVFAVFRATMTAPDDTENIAELVESYKKLSKHGVESGAVVGIIDVIRDRPDQAVGKIDGAVLGTILSTYGKEACLQVQKECIKLEEGESLFDDSVSSKLSEIMTHFDAQLWKARKKDKIERVVLANMDPAGMNQKVKGGRMLDPTDPKSLDLMHNMLKSLSRQVWRPLKSFIGKELGASLEVPQAFLQITEREEQQLYDHLLLKARVTYTDIANLCTLLLLSFSFQHSQVLREATIDEFVLTPDGTQYKFSFSDRRFKTASASGTSSAPPVSHFMLTPDQSMIIKFISTVGHKFCCAKNNEERNKRLFINSKGQSWTQKDISSRFKMIGIEWLGIENFGPHVCRTFWASSALNSGKIGAQNLEDFSSFLQVSSNTLRNSYMSSTANTAAQMVGNDVLGAVMNAACTGETTTRNARPYGTKLSARRLEFVQDNRASIAKYNGNSRNLFRELLQKRNTSRLLEGEAWFRWERTFFGEGDERLFDRFLKANSIVV